MLISVAAVGLFMIVFSGVALWHKNRNQNSEEMFVLDGVADNIWICQEDLEHYCRFLATASKPGAKGPCTPSPVEVVKMDGFGVVPDNYLDRFPPESTWYEDIQEFKLQVGE